MVRRAIVLVCAAFALAAVVWALPLLYLWSLDQHLWPLGVAAAIGIVAGIWTELDFPFLDTGNQRSLFWLLVAVVTFGIGYVVGSCWSPLLPLSSALYGLATLIASVTGAALGLLLKFAKDILFQLRNFSLEVFLESLARICALQPPSSIS